MTWSRIDERRNDPTVERQLHEYGCGAACATMLLRDRGIVVGQAEVSRELRQPSTAHELAERLNELTVGRHVWIGGQLDLEPPLGRPVLDGLGRRGSWAAQLIPQGAVHGHGVVVGTSLEASLVQVRDPGGSSYGIPWGEFATLLRFMVVVFEGGV